MKKLLILVLSLDKEPWVNLKKTQKETWVLNNSNGVDVVFYQGGKENIEFKEFENFSELYLPHSEGLYNIGHKTIKAFDFFKDKYEYIFRTNSSSYLDIDVLYNHVLKTNLDYSGYIGRHNGVEFASGSGYLISNELIKIVLENKNKWNHNYIDDVSLAFLLNEFDIKPKLAKRLDITSLNFDENAIKNREYYHYRCKISNDRNIDTLIMKKIYNILK